jgi:hypothetical protein
MANGQCQLPNITTQNPSKEISDVPEVSRDRTGAFLEKLFQILIDNGEPMAAQEAMNALRSSFVLRNCLNRLDKNCQSSQFTS